MTRTILCVFLTFLVAGLLSNQPASGESLKNKSAPKIVFLETMDIPIIKRHTFWTRHYLREMGYAEKSGTVFTILNGDGDKEKTNLLLEEIVKKIKPDVVISEATLATMLSHAVLPQHDIPQVFNTVADPVGAKLVEKVGQANGRGLTGVVYSISREKKIDAFIRIMGTRLDKVVRVGVILSNYPSALGDASQVLPLLREIDNVKVVKKVIPYEKRSSNETVSDTVEAAIAELDQIKEDIDMLWLVAGPLAESPEFIDEINNRGVPIAFAPNEMAIEKGALFALGASEKGTGNKTAWLVDQILRGKPAGSLPIDVAKNIRFSVNLSTATAMEVVIPVDLLELARNSTYK
jgi:putative ABC transport system substrate-binding protein